MILALLGCISLAVSAQTGKVTICRGISDEGKPLGAGTEFHFTSTPAGVYVLIQLDEPVNYYRVMVKLYRIIEDKEEYDNSFTISTELDWQFFWQEIVFSRSGEYMVYAYKGDQEELIGSSNMKIRF